MSSDHTLDVLNRIHELATAGRATASAEKRAWVLRKIHSLASAERLRQSLRGLAAASRAVGDGWLKDASLAGVPVASVSGIVAGSDTPSARGELIIPDATALTPHDALTAIPADADPHDTREPVPGEPQADEPHRVNWREFI